MADLIISVLVCLSPSLLPGNATGGRHTKAEIFCYEHSSNEPRF
jgi:hypothetical protein